MVLRRGLAASCLTAFLGLAGACSEDPFASDPILAPLASVSAGILHTCAVSVPGVAYCWGWNRDGQAGDGSHSDRPLPVRVAGSLVLQSVTAGAGHTCGVAAGGGAQCWGFNLTGQLGDGSGADQSTPVPVAGGRSFATLDAGGAYTCGITADSLAFCWGWNLTGQLGDGSRQDRETPVAVVGGRKLVQVAAAVRHTCALGADSTVYCWGANDRGQLGNGLDADTTQPVPVSGGLKYTAVATGFDHTCALTVTGEAYCWGDNGLGQLGDTAVSAATVPHAVESDGVLFSALATGGTHSCGVAANGAAYCWGNGSAGQLGAPPTVLCATSSGSFPCSPLPLPVAGALSFASLTAGNHHTCGLTVNDVAYCWGLNDRGQLGDGTRTTKTTPVRVATQEGVP